MNFYNGTKEGAGRALLAGMFSCGLFISLSGMDMLDYVALMVQHVIVTYPVGDKFPAHSATPKKTTQAAKLASELPAGTAQWWLKFFYWARSGLEATQGFGMKEFHGYVVNTLIYLSLLSWIIESQKKLQQPPAFHKNCFRPKYIQEAFASWRQLQLLLHLHVNPRLSKKESKIPVEYDFPTYQSKQTEDAEKRQMVSFFHVLPHSSLTLFSLHCFNLTTTSRQFKAPVL